MFPGEITASHLVFEGRPAHIAAIRDITARVQADDALRQPEAFNRILLETSPVGIDYLDQDGLVAVTHILMALEQHNGQNGEESLPIFHRRGNGDSRHAIGRTDACALFPR